eukprot:TRINITY_DN13881_c0_g1_i1.p1 TRINITY_DN13881_c0_g1~~TRINITY_DN13881_c0_g1_i1.p1  ORF type:complete len:100 (-),score=2.52 TRINITY_DN13881_c0_g1_i1:29-328(-)
MMDDGGSGCLRLLTAVTYKTGMSKTATQRPPSTRGILCWYMYECNLEICSVSSTLAPVSTSFEFIVCLFVMCPATMVRSPHDLCALGFTLGGNDSAAHH